MGLLRVVLVDLSSLFWAAWHVHNENGVQEARTATLAGVKRCIGEGPALVAICCDSGKSFRKEISETYKAQREKQPEAAYGELQKTKDRLAADGFMLWQAEGFEADDVIATACKLARDKGHEVRVCSADKDLLQLCGPGVDVLRTHTWEVWSSREVTERLKVDAGQLGDFLALQGDVSDNIPGCPGVGKVRAAELLTKFDTIDGIYEALRATPEGDLSKVDKALISNRADVLVSRRLVQLRFDVPIDFEALYAERRPAPLAEVTDEMIDELGTAEPEEKTPTKELEVIEVNAPMAPLAFTQQLEPRNFKELVIGCRVLYNSRYYQKFGTYEALVGAALRGREMGYGLCASLDIFHPMDVKGVKSLALHAHVIIDRAMKDPDCEYFDCVETSSEKATYEVKRRSRKTPFVLTYTIEQARRSNLVRSGQNWELRPDEMLRKTCGVQAARVVFPGAAMGLYSLEEFGAGESLPQGRDGAPKGGE